MADTAIEFPKPEFQRCFQSHRDTAFRPRATEPDVAAAPLRKTVSRAGGASSAPIEIDKLYPASDGAGADLIKALGLLADAIRLIEEARGAQPKDALEADHCVQRLQMMVPRLFFWRSIGEGYAVLINSLHFAFINQRGRLLTFEQMTTLWRILKELRTRPFLPFDQALGYIGEMEAAQFEVDPPILSEILEDPDDEQGLR